MIRRIICLVVASLFLVNCLCYGLSVAPASRVPAEQTEIVGVLTEVMTAKNGDRDIVEAIDGFEPFGVVSDKVRLAAIRDEATGIAGHPVPVGESAVNPSYWHMTEGSEPIPNSMWAVTYVPGRGPSLCSVSTEYLKDPLRWLGLPCGSKMVLVKLTNVSVCPSDRHNLENDANATAHRASGWVGGHEGGGTIDYVSDGVDPTLLGKHVAIESHGPHSDKMDKPWHDGQNITNGYSIIGFNNLGSPVPIAGIWSQYVLLQVGNVYPVSSKVKERLNGQTSLLEPNGNAVFTVLKLTEELRAKGKDPKTARVLIFGLGGQGRMMMHIAKSMGLNVIGVDTSAGAKKLYIDMDIGSASDVFCTTEAGFNPEMIRNALGGEADAIIDACGAEGSVLQNAGYLKDGGTFLLFGLLKAKQIVPGTGETLEAFVLGQHSKKDVPLDGKKIDLVGVCGRSPDSWKWIVGTLEGPGGDKLAELMLSGTKRIDSLVDLAKYFPAYNGGEMGQLTAFLNSGKIVMTHPFPEELSGSPEGLGEISTRFGIPGLQLIGSKPLANTSMVGAVLPASDDVKLSTERITGTWSAVRLFHETKIEIIIPQRIKLNGGLEEDLKKVRRERGEDAIRCEPYADKDHLERLLSQATPPGVKRIVLTDKEAGRGALELVREKPELFVNIRSFGFDFPDGYAAMSDADRTFYQTRMITTAILLRLRESNGRMPLVDMILESMLDGCIEGATPRDFLDNMVEAEGEAGYKDLPPAVREAVQADIIKRIEYCLGKTMSLIGKIAENLERVRLEMKVFWTAA